MKKKSNKRKTKKFDEEEILPSKHEKVGNVNCYSEQIVKEIINKIISLALTNNFMKEINKKIDNYYTIYVLREINNLIEIKYINHDMDIYMPLDIENKSFKVEPTKEIKKRKIQEKKIYNKNNNIEDNYSKKEIITKKTFTEEFNNESLNKQDILYNAKILNNNFWETITEPQSFSFERTSVYKNVIEKPKLKIQKKIKNLIENKEITKTLRKNKTKYNTNIIQKNRLDISKIGKKSIIKIIDAFPSEKIPDDILGITKEDDDIKNLRKIFLEEIEKKNLEEKIRKEKKRLEEIAKKMEKEKKEKNKKNSKDKGISPDTFIKDFILISSTQKEIKGGMPKSFIEIEKKKLTEKAKKNIEYNQIPKIKTERELFKQRKLQQKIFIKKYVLHNFNKEDENEELESNIIPSGVNFELIKPEIGVVIQEDEKIKSGGNNYYAKYNRFSFSDFNRTMNNVYERNSSNFNNIDSNNININNINNETVPVINKNMNKNINEIEPSKKEEILDEKKLFRKTFMNKLSNIKKKFIYKSSSEICLSSNYDTKIFVDTLSSEKNQKINTNNFLNTKYLSPIPSNLINIYNNTIIKDYQNTSRDRFNKYKIMDTFNKNILDKNYKFNEILYQKITKNNPNYNLPRIKYINSPFLNIGGRTKNYFLRTRKKIK